MKKDSEHSILAAVCCQWIWAPKRGQHLGMGNLNQQSLEGSQMSRRLYFQKPPPTISMNFKGSLVSYQENEDPVIYMSCEGILVKNTSGRGGGVAGNAKIPMPSPFNIFLHSLLALIQP